VWRDGFVVSLLTKPPPATKSMELSGVRNTPDCPQNFASRYRGIKDFRIWWLGFV